jgi:hypothetical protein
MSKRRISHRVVAGCIATVAGVLAAAPVTAQTMDVCNDSFLAWQLTMCDTEVARQGRAARGIPEPKHTEDPKIARERLREWFRVNFEKAGWSPPKSAPATSAPAK